MQRRRDLAGLDPRQPDGLQDAHLGRKPVRERRMFSAAGRYGRWLLSRPVLLQINDTLFLHGA